MFALLLAATIQGELATVDLSAIPPAACAAAIEKLPEGNGRCLRINVFDGPTVLASEQGAQTLARQVQQSASAANQKGYRVLGEWDTLHWNGVRQLKGAEAILEHRAANAFAAKPEYDVVSPMSPMIQECLRKYATALGAVKPKFDLLRVTYRVARQPILAYGIDSRRQYIAEADLDPADLSESPTLRRGDQPNKEILRYMEWRLEKSDAFFNRLYGQIVAALPETPVAVTADPSWIIRTPAERGSHLNDWVFLLSKRRDLKIYVDHRADGDQAVVEVSHFTSTLLELNEKPQVWVETPPKPTAAWTGALDALRAQSSRLTVLSPVGNR